MSWSVSIVGKGEALASAVAAKFDAAAKNYEGADPQSQAEHTDIMAAKALALSTLAMGANDPASGFKIEASGLRSRGYAQVSVRVEAIHVEA